MNLRLYTLLKARNMSQAELARRIGITPESLSKKFLKKSPLLWREVKLICKILSIENPLDVFE